MATTELILKLEVFLKCSLCQKLMEKPTTLDCFHSICKKCLASINQTGENGSEIHCQVCGSSSMARSLEVNQLMKAFVDLHNTLQGDSFQCELCLATEPDFKCLDCKLDLCINCKRTHLRVPQLKEHHLVEISGLHEVVIDHTSVTLCTVHCDKVLVLNCKDCEKPVCVHCTVTDHQAHTLETIKDALDRIKIEVKKYVSRIDLQLEYIDENVASEETNFKTAKEGSKKQDVSLEHQNGISNYGDTSTTIDGLLNEYDTINNITQDTNKVQQISPTASPKMQKEVLKKLQYNHMKHWIEICLEISDGLTLLMELQNVISKVPKNLKKPDSESTSDISTIVSKHHTKFTNTPLIFPISFCAFNKATEVNLKGKCSNIALVNTEIWCTIPSSDCIEIYELMCHRLRVIVVKYIIRNPRCVEQASNGDVLLASDSGIHLIDQNGSPSHLHLICDGKFCDLSIDKNVLVGLNYRDANILIFECDNTGWNQKSLFEVDTEFCVCESTVLFDAHSNVIYVSSKTCIKQYNMNGRLLQTFCGLFWPRLCQVDIHGTVLFVDSSPSDRSLKCLCENCSKCVVDFTDSCPLRCVYITCGCLFIVLYNSRSGRYTLTRYCKLW